LLVLREIAMPHQIYAFGSFQLNVAERQLASHGRAIRIHGKVFDTLVVFVADAGRLLRKNVLMKSIWPDHVVEENNLQHNICVLRRVLEQHDGQSFIETVPGQGYRFMADVQILERATPTEVLELPKYPPTLLTMQPARMWSSSAPAEFLGRQANRADAESPSLNEADQLSALLQRLDQVRHSFRELAGELAEIEHHLRQRGALPAGRLARP